MALNKTLDRKVEETIAGSVLQEAKLQETERVREPDVSAIDDPLELAQDVQEPEQEPVQVAGLGTVVRGAKEALKQRADEAGRRVTMDQQPEPVQVIDDTIVISPADPDEIAALETVLGEEYTRGLNFPAIFEAEGLPDSADFMARLKAANEELFEQARRGTIPVDKMIEMAQQRGLNGVVAKLVDRKPGDIFNNEDFVAAIIATAHLEQRYARLTREMESMVPGAELEEAGEQARALYQLLVHTAANASGTASEYGRGLQMAGALQRQGIPDPASLQLPEIATDATIEQIVHHGRVFRSINDPAARQRFLDKSVSLGEKAMDVTAEVFVGSILTAIPTHVVNIAGNAMYLGTHVLESALAGGVGMVRTAGKEGANRARVSEALSQLEGIRRSVLDGLLVAGRTAITETPSDLRSKIDTRTRRAIGTTGDLTEIAGMVRSGEFGPAFVNSLGVTYRLGMRALLAEDEFFKAIGGRAELYRIADEQSRAVFNQAIAAGENRAQATAKAAQTRADVINNPPPVVQRQVRDVARDLTFQGDIPGIFGKAGQTFSHPMVKLFVPFYNTPMNIAKAVLERTPLQLAYPGFYRKIKAGGREADVAIAKVALGSGIMYAFSELAMGTSSPDQDVIVIGSNLTRSAERMGFQKHSINLKQEDGSYTSITYSRFDPMSGLLAISADYAYYAQHEDDPEVLNDLAMQASLTWAQMAGEKLSSAAKAGTMGTLGYVGTLPLTQGPAEIFSALMSPDLEGRAEKLERLLAQKATEAGLAFIPTVSSFTASVARVEDPTQRSTLLPEDATDYPDFAKGFYDALQRAKARNPFFNQDLPPRLNLWGEEMQAGNGTAWEMFNPVRIKDVKFSALDAELNELGGNLPGYSRKIDGKVELNAQQYHDWIKLTNSIDAMGRSPGAPGYDASTTLVVVLDDLIKSELYLSQPTNDDRLKVIRSVFADYKSAAKQKLLEGDAKLRYKVNSLQ